MAKHERKRAKGGPAEAEMEREKEEAEEAGEKKRAAGGAVAARKSGGMVHGKMPMARPDRRARGGATSDENPFTAAGKMSKPSYEGVGSKPNGGGAGADRD